MAGPFLPMAFPNVGGAYPLQTTSWPQLHPGASERAEAAPSGGPEPEGAAGALSPDADQAARARAEGETGTRSLNQPPIFEVGS